MMGLSLVMAYRRLSQLDPTAGRSVDACKNGLDGGKAEKSGDGHGQCRRNNHRDGSMILKRGAYLRRHIEAAKQIDDAKMHQIYGHAALPRTG